MKQFKRRRQQGMTFIGLTFALQLWFAKNLNRIANRYLALALVIMILWMVRILVIDVRLKGAKS